MRILTEHVPGVRSVSLGIWVGTGSRHESAGENGAAHFIEHMLFKGTRSRTAAQLAEEMDAVGGQINAFTTKECTCFYARVLDTHLARAADILCDMFFHSRFDDADVETERGVILEEIGMYEDNPEDLCAERLAGAVFKGSPLARPILGRKATLDKMDGAWLRAYQRAHYRPDRIVVALAGSFTDADAVELAGRFAGLEARPHTAARAAAYVPGVVVKKKAIEQNHLTLAFPGLSFARSPGGSSSSSCPPSWGAACPPACSSRCGSRRGFATPSTPTAPAMTIPATSASTPPWGGRPRDRRWTPFWP